MKVAAGRAKVGAMSSLPPHIADAHNTERTAAAHSLGVVIDDKTAVVAVIGLGFIGSLVAEAVLKAGFQVKGIDRNPAAVEAARRQLGIEAALTPEAIDGADVVFVAVRALVRPDHSLDMEPFRSVAATLRAAAPRPRLVLMESTLPPGGTREFARELVAAAREPLFVAHSPERLSVGHGVTDFQRIPHLVGGLDPDATRLGAAMLGAMVERVVPVSQPEVSELSKLLENSFMTVAITLAEEVARLARAHGLEGREVTGAAATKPFGYYAFHPGPGIGGHCLPNDLEILRHALEEAAGGSALLDAASAVVADLPERTVGRLAGLLGERGLGLEGALVLLVGVGFKVGSADTTETPARAIVRSLRSHGARPVYLDTRVPAFSVDGAAVPRLSPEELADHPIAGVLVLAGDPGVDGNLLQGPVLLDTGGGRALRSPLLGAVRL